MNDVASGTLIGWTVTDKKKKLLRVGWRWAHEFGDPNSVWCANGCCEMVMYDVEENAKQAAQDVGGEVMAVLDGPPQQRPS